MAIITIGLLYSIYTLTHTPSTQPLQLKLIRISPPVLRGHQKARRGMREISMWSTILSPSGCMSAMAEVLVRLVQSSTYGLVDIYWPRCCADSGRAIRAVLPNRNNGASLWAELRGDVGNGAGKPESGLGWCALPLSGRSGPESCRAFNDLGRRPSCAKVQGGSSGA